MAPGLLPSDSDFPITRGFSLKSCRVLHTEPDSRHQTLLSPNLNGNCLLTRNQPSRSTTHIILIPFLNRRKARVIAALLLWVAGVAFAQPNPAYNPPAGYYSSATGLTGSSLKSALHNIIDGHTVIPYTSTATDAWDALQVLDEDPANPANVILIYSGVSSPKSDTNGNGNTTITNASWEREHCWPKSFGVIDTGPDTSDLFNLRACRRSVNASRNNRIYDLADVNHPTDPAIAPPNCPECLYDYNYGQGDLWTPRPSERGDLARAMFYMAVRYDGSDSNTVDLELSDTPNALNGIFGRLSTLVAWSNADPVSEEERLRNHRIYSQYQGNRNPFIDHPEMIASVFGSVAELPALTMTITPSSVTEGNISAGQVSVSVALASPLVVTLSKAGDPADTEISIPSNVTIPAGQTSAPFTVNALLDGTVDGDTNISILGAASGYETGLATVSVLDIDEGPTGTFASIVITEAGHYTQNFNSLLASGSETWTDATTIPGWYAKRSGSGTSITANSGSSVTGDLYSYGLDLSDRALGSLGSGNAAAGSFAWGVSFQNSTGTSITLGNLEYIGEQWRYVSASEAQTITFSYKIGTSVVSDLTPASDTGWSPVSTLDFTSPISTGTSGAKDGNDMANRTSLSTVLNLQLLPGEWITFRWRDIDHSSSDHGLAIDDFRLDWSLPVLPEPPVITSTLAAAAQVGAAFTYTITADNSPTFFEAESLPDGLLLDGLTGVISGYPELAGSYEVSILAGNDGGIDQSTLIITVSPAATRFAIWSGDAAPAPVLIQAYAIGGAPDPASSGEVATVAHSGNMLILTAIVRTDDPTLTVMGEASANLTNFGVPGLVTEVTGTAQAVSQSGVPPGCQRQEFRVLTQGADKLFMRLRVELEP